MTPRNLQTIRARLFLDSLAEAGLTDLVVSPGSRSTPYVLAAARTAGLTLHDCVDERAAAFFALGMARVTGRATALLCTSGTAPAHYYPAVIEASVARVPLLVLTADRPVELAACGAPQTVDQVRLFGVHARFFELGEPTPTARSLHATRRVAAQALLATRWPEPGAVHVNLRARKPLEPIGAESDDEHALAALAEEVRRSPVPRPHPPKVAADPVVVARIGARITGRRRGLVVCGPGPLTQAGAREAVAGLCRSTGWPLLAEATSQLRFAPAPGVVVVDAFDHLLAAGFGATHPPEVVVQVGAPPVASSWEPYLDAHPNCERIVVAPWGWLDPPSTATDLLLAEVEPTVRALARAVRPASGPSAWAEAWGRANVAAWRAVREHAEPTEGAIVARALAAVGPDAQLVVGNSLAVRLLDHFVPADRAPLPVLAQRGASGIDGLISGAAGAATASGRPTLLVLGDVSAMHDLNGLLLAPKHVPLCVLVLQNGGGRIFELLPIARHGEVTPDELAHLTTPHDRGFRHAAAQFGARYACPEPAEVASAVQQALASAGCTVVEAVVPPHGAARALAAIRQAIRG